MRWRLCQCEVNGLVRPTNGPVRIKTTDIVDQDVLKARLSGPAGGTAHAVRIRGHYYYVNPRSEIREVPADSLTDALHAAVFMQNLELKERKKLPHRKRPMPHVPVSKIKKKKA